MEKVMKSSAVPDAKKAERDLAILIYDYLLEERYDRTGLPKRIKEQLYRTTNCLERVYRIGFTDCPERVYRISSSNCLERVYRISFTDCVLMKDRHPLPVVFLTGFELEPIKVKDRLKAEEHKKKGNAFMEDNKSFKAAEIEYSRAIHLNPRNAVYWCNRAVSRIGLESYFSAISDCKKALELDRSYTKALVWKGIAHALTDHPEGAIRCYRMALRIEPWNEVCIANLDLINRKYNRTAFRALDPLCRYGRHLARTVVSMANNRQDLFKWVKSDKSFEEEYRKRQKYLQKFSYVTLD